MALPGGVPRAPHVKSPGRLARRVTGVARLLAGVVDRERVEALAEVFQRTRGRRSKQDGHNSATAHRLANRTFSVDRL
jgi:hypothetical protein